MKIQSICLVSKNPMVFGGIHKNPVQNSKSEIINITPELKSVNSDIAMAQFCNVNFKGNYGRDDFSAYDNYEGPTPPQIELEKYRRSLQIQQDIDDENYLAAIQGKIGLARIVRNQGKERDAYLLENSIRDLYKDLPNYQKEQAKRIISEYNYDMAKYIDQDICR